MQKTKGIIRPDGRRKVRQIVCVIASFLILSCWISSVFAQQIPHFIKYQSEGKKILEEIEKGEKEKDKGKEKDLYALTFRIYNIETGGTALWKETHLDVPIKKKKFEVLLGSFTPLDLRFDEDYWLSIEIDSKGEIEPRERMTSFGYAYMSEDSYKLGGRYPDDFAIFGHSHIGEDVVSPVAEAINADTVDGLHAYQIGGVKDHGLLEGLADDDHLQYLNNVRGDERYAGLGWNGLTKLETVQSHIADKNNPHLVTLEQLGYLDNNPEEEAPTFTERGEPTGAEIQGWADDVTVWGHSNLVMNLNADMVDGLHATMSGNPQANTLVALGADMKFPSSVIPSITEAANADTVDSIHASAVPTPNYLLPLDSTGKFPASIISGAVGEATNADTVDGIHANTMATANYLYPLNTNAKFPASILEGIVADADKLDGKDSSEFSLIGHFHALQDLSDVSLDEAAAFNAAGAAGASGANRLATMADIIAAPGLWTDEGTYIYPNNVGNGFRITDVGDLFLNGISGVGTLTPGNIPGYPTPTLTIGQSVVGNNVDYSLAIFRHGTSVNPGTYSTNAPALYVEDFSGNAPAIVDDTGIVRINAYRIGDNTPNATNATIFNVTNDQGGALRIDGRRNSFIGYSNPVTSAEVGSLFINGKVGIGTTNLDTNLGNPTIVHIRDPRSTITSMLLSNEDTTGYTQITARGGAINRSGSFGYYNTAHNPGSGSELLGPDAVVLSSASGVTGGLRLIAANNGTHNAPIIFATGLWYAQAAERMRITSYGYVGIGTSDPQGRLDVNGAIYQRGALLHADYVFEPGYQLESIEDHAKYMWQEKHLKAVPKANKTEGGQEIVEVGARGRGVLEELEKAHIYIAQLNERIKQLEAKLAEK